MISNLNSKMSILRESYLTLRDWNANWDDYKLKTLGICQRDVYKEKKQ